MAEVAYPPFVTQTGEGNPTADTRPDQTGAASWRGRDVRFVGSPDTGESPALADGFLRSPLAGHAGDDMFEWPHSSTDEEAPVRGKPLGDRQARVVVTEGDVPTPEARVNRETDPWRGTTGGQTPAPAHRDAIALQSPSGRAADGFRRERAAALAEVQALQLDEDAKASIAEQVMRGEISAPLVSALGGAYLRIQDDLGWLGGPLSPRDLQYTLRSIRNAMNNAFDEAGVEIDAANRLQAFKTFWRFVLAPGNSAQAILNQFEPPQSPLRAVGEAAYWYCGEHQRSQPAQRPPRRARQSHRTERQPPQAARQPGASTRAKPAQATAAHRESLKNATDYSVMLRSLAQVLDEKTGMTSSSLLIIPNNNVPDETIVTLRNLGVRMPAPARLGQQNRSALISEGTLEAVRRQLDEHLRVKNSESSGTPILEECVRDIPCNSYSIGGRDLPSDNASVGEEMINFCKGRDGSVNQVLLKNLSMLAYRGGFNCVLDTCLKNAQPEVALFSEEPVMSVVGQSHDLSRARNGDVILRSELHCKVNQLKTRNEQGEPEAVDLDADNSHVHLAIRYKLDGTTGQPALDDIDIGYAFMPLDEGSEGDATADTGSSDSEESDDSELTERLQRLRDD